MNIGIGDKVKILDREMKDYYRKTGVVVDVDWTFKIKEEPDMFLYTDFHDLNLKK